MCRDYLSYEAEPSRGVCSKQFVAELHEQGVGREEAIEAVSQRFGVTHRAACLYVLSHPAWAEESERPAELQGRIARAAQTWHLDYFPPSS